MSMCFLCFLAIRTMRSSTDMSPLASSSAHAKPIALVGDGPFSFIFLNACVAFALLDDLRLVMGGYLRLVYLRCDSYASGVGPLPSTLILAAWK